VGAGVSQGRRCEFPLEVRDEFAEGVDVRGVEADDEPVRDEHPVRRAEPAVLDRALDPALELQWLEAGPEQPSRRSLEDSFEEPFEGSEGAHVRGGSLAAGAAEPVPGPCRRAAREAARLPAGF
jgi:hypothetical protein